MKRACKHRDGSNELGEAHCDASLSTFFSRQSRPERRVSLASKLSSKQLLKASTKIFLVILCSSPEYISAVIIKQMQLDYHLWSLVLAVIIDQLLCLHNRLCFK